MRSVCRWARVQKVRSSDSTPWWRNRRLVTSASQSHDFCSLALLLQNFQKCAKGSRRKRPCCTTSHKKIDQTCKMKLIDFFVCFCASVWGTPDQHEGADPSLGGAEKRGELISELILFIIIFTLTASSARLPQLLLINKKWAKEYRSMVQYYKQKVGVRSHVRFDIFTTSFIFFCRF